MIKKDGNYKSPLLVRLLVFFRKYEFITPNIRGKVLLTIEH